MYKKLTENQRELLEKSFSIIHPDILYYKRPKQLSNPELIESCLIAQKMLLQNNTRKMILDMTCSSLPTLSNRKLGKELFSIMKERLDHWVVIVPDAFFVVPLRFITKNFDCDTEISIVETMDEALEILCA